MLGALAILKVASNTDAYNEMVLERLERDIELQHADIILTDQLGRPPTARELWEYCPPKEQQQ